MTYVEQIKSPKWQKKRLKILERDDYECQSCGETEDTLHVHHLAYHKGFNIYDYSDKELITLCESCHEYVTEKYNDVKKRLQYKMFCIDMATEIQEIVKMISNMDLYQLHAVGSIIKVAAKAKLDHDTICEIEPETFINPF